MRTSPDIEPNIEIDAEFWEPETLEPQERFALTLDALDAIEDMWRDQGKTELADAAANLSDKMRLWQQQNQV